MKRQLLLFVACTFAAAISLRASIAPFGTADVAFGNVANYQTVTLTVGSTTTSGVEAGVYHLTVNGVPNVDSFCIDPVHDASGTTQTYYEYHFTELPNADSAYAGYLTTLSSSAINTIEQLVGKFYTSNTTALYDSTSYYQDAVLQTAIWKEIAEGTGKTFSIDTAAMDSAVTSMLSDLSGAPSANLTALVNPDKQSYAIGLSEVPEPSTCLAGVLLLLPFGLSSLRVLRRNRIA
jgi:hypothetical protein